MCVHGWGRGRCCRKTRNTFQKKGRYNMVSSSQLMTDKEISYFQQIHICQILPTVDAYKLQGIPSKTQETHKLATAHPHRIELLNRPALFSGNPGKPSFLTESMKHMQCGTGDH